MTGPSSGADHDWRVFDAEFGMEAAQIDNVWYIRYISDRSQITSLTDVEFNQLRGDGPNPKGLD